MAPPVLECVEVSKRFGGVHALNRVSFEVGRGEVLALAGDNGAGKSTLIKIVSGVLRPDEGEYPLQGRARRLHRPEAGARARHRDDLPGPGAGR